MSYPQDLSYDRETRVVLVGTTVCPRDQRNLPPLPQVKRNIIHLARLFTDSDVIGLPLESIVTIIDCEHTSEILYEIAKAAEAASDTLIVYYAGHGLFGDQTTPLYLTTKNTISAIKSFTGLRITDVKSAIRSSRARKRILILDCCYSGRAFEGGMGSTEDEVRAAIDVATYGIAAVPGDYKALAPAGAELTKFTQTLVDVIEQGVPGAGQVLTIDQVFNAVRVAVGREAMPLPEANNWKDGRQFKLVKNRSFRRQTVFPEALSTQNRAVYFQPGEVLAKTAYAGELQDFRFPYQKAAYLRLFPTHQGPHPGVEKLLSIFLEGKPCPMSEIRVGSISSRNRFGPIIYRLGEPGAQQGILSLTQAFETGELWGISSEIFDEPIRMVAFESLHVFALRNYLEIMLSELNCGPPYFVELGLVGLKD